MCRKTITAASTALHVYIGKRNYTYRESGVGSSEARVRLLLLRRVLLEPEALVRGERLLRVRLLSVLLLSRLLLRRGLLLCLLLGRLLRLLLLRQLLSRSGSRCRRDTRLLLLESATEYSSRGEQVGRVRSVVGGVRLGVAVQARKWGAAGCGGRSRSGGCCGGRRLDTHATHSPDEGLSGPLPLAVGASRLAPRQPHAATADGRALHVVDDVLGAGAVREGHKGAAAAGRRGNRVDLARAGESVAEYLLGDGVVDAADEDRGIAGVCRVCTGLPYAFFSKSSSSSPR